MQLLAGTRLGPYEVLGPIGAGGMGEVYRARDRKLDRDVALKILPEEFASDPERLARFAREAKVLASLNHPHIAHIHGIEDGGPSPALVLEYVEGHTLQELVTAGSGLPIDEALTVARQIADALETAHEHGIMHRDLKPANVKVTPDGTVKVLDFGLAKALDAGASSVGRGESAVITTPAMTYAGVVLGTAAYMSPEQARGKTVDRRTDVWAFGCVLYECLTGRMAFSGETVSDVIAKVLEREPDWSALPAATPTRVRDLLVRCLTRDPRQRLRDMGEARIALEEARHAPQGLAGESRGTAAMPGRWTRGRIAWASLGIATLLGALVVGATLFLAGGNQPVNALVIRAAIPLPPGQVLDGFGAPSIAISRDGRTIAFVARGATGQPRLFVRRLDRAEAAPVPGSESAEGPFFSPDGRWVAFAVGVSVTTGIPPELRKYSIDSGLTQTVSALADFFGGVWAADDTLLFVGAQPTGLWRVPASGGQPQSVVSKFRIDGKDVTKSVLWPDLLPGERVALVTDWDAPGLGEILAVDLATRETTRLGLVGAGARYTPSGHVVYAGASASLMATRFDLRTVRPTGSPVAVMPNVAIARNISPAFAFSEFGTFIFATGYLARSRREPSRIVRLSRTGVAETLRFDADLFVRGPAVSPDGTQLAATTWDGAQWVLDIVRGTRVKLAGAEQTGALNVLWHPEGRRLVLGLSRPSGFVIASDATGTGDVERLADLGAVEPLPAGWLPDGRTMIVGANDFGMTTFSVTAHPPGEKARVVLKEPGGIVQPVVSPDGRWLAYATNSSGDFQIYVSPLAGAGSRIAVTTGGGNLPVWSRDGRELYFRRGRQFLAVAVESVGSGLRLGDERVLFESDAGPVFGVGTRGEFYAFSTMPDGAQQTAIQLQTAWFTELERAAGR